MDDHWRWVQYAEPRRALAAGHSGALTHFENRSPDTRARTRREADQLLGWLRQQDPAALSMEDRETWVLLERSLQEVVDEPVCHLDRWLVSETRNPFAEATRAGMGRELSGRMAIRLVARVERLPTQVEHEIRSLRLGLASGRVAGRVSGPASTSPGSRGLHADGPSAQRQQPCHDTPRPPQEVC